MARGPVKKPAVSFDELVTRTGKALTKKGIAHDQDTTALAISIFLDTLKKAITHPKRSNGDFIDLPDMIRFNIKEKPERVARAPRSDIPWRAKGSTRAVSVSVRPKLKEVLTDKFEQPPSKKMEEMAEKKNEEAGAPAPKTEKKVKKDKTEKKVKKDKGEKKAKKVKKNKKA